MIQTATLSSTVATVNFAVDIFQDNITERTEEFGVRLSIPEETRQLGVSLGSPSELTIRIFGDECKLLFM